MHIGNNYTCIIFKIDIRITAHSNTIEEKLPFHIPLSRKFSDPTKRDEHHPPPTNATHPMSDASI